MKPADVSGQAVFYGVLNDQLKAAFGDQKVQKRVINPAGHLKPLVHAELLKLNVVVGEAKLLREGNFVGAVDGIAHVGSKARDHIVESRLVVHECLGSDGLKRVVEKMRIDLCLQRLNPRILLIQ